MKQFKKRSLMFLVVLALMASLFFTTNASASTNNNLTVDIEEARNVAIDLVIGDMKTTNNTNWKPGVGISKSTALFDLNNNPSAYLFELSDKQGNDDGYIMVSASKNENPIIEFAYTGKPFISNAINITKADIEKRNLGKKVKAGKTKLYYLGDLTYLAEHELDDNTKQVYDITTGDFKTVNTDELKKINFSKNYDSQYQNIWNSSIKNHFKQSTGGSNPPDNNTDFITDPSKYESGYDTYSSKDVTGYYRSYNIMSSFSTGGVCAPTAATNLCQYWYARNNTKYAKLYDDKLGWQGTFNSFFSLMKTSQTSGTDDSNVAPAYPAFFSSKGLSCTASYTLFTDNGMKVANELDNDRPCHLLLHSNKRYGDHSVVALGYKKYGYYDYVFLTTNYSTYIRIADGWINYPDRFVWGACSGYWAYVTVIPS